MFQQSQIILMDEPMLLSSQTGVRTKSGQDVYREAKLGRKSYLVKDYKDLPITHILQNASIEIDRAYYD